MSEQIEKDLVALIQEASDRFDQQAQERHEEGAEKYGPFKFLEANTLEEAMFEMVDLANYARYTWIKLYLLNLKLDEQIGEDEIPASGFFSGRPDIAKEKG